MAEYGRVGTGADWMKPEDARNALGIPTKTSRVQKKLKTTHTFEFGTGPYTVEDFLAFADEIRDLPPGAKGSISHGDSQKDGEWLKVSFTI